MAQPREGAWLVVGWGQAAAWPCLLRRGRVPRSRRDSSSGPKLGPAEGTVPRALCSARCQSRSPGAPRGLWHPAAQIQPLRPPVQVPAGVGGTEERECPVFSPVTRRLHHDGNSSPVLPPEVREGHAGKAGALTVVGVPNRGSLSVSLLFLGAFLLEVLFKVNPLTIVECIGQ